METKGREFKRRRDSSVSEGYSGKDIKKGEIDSPLNYRFTRVPF